MALVDMVMPKMGESIVECTIISWLKKPGDRIEADDSVLEVATDKVDTEVPSSHAGILKEILVNDGDVVAIGSPVARIEVEGNAEDLSASPTPDSPPFGETEEQDVASVAAKLEDDLSQISSRNPEIRTDAETGVSENNRFYSPLVLSIVKAEGISQAELASIKGTGAENRITKNDILAYVEKRKSEPVSTGASFPKAASITGQNDIIQMDRMRKMIAERMVESKRIAPHVSSFVETDMTVLVQWRERNKKTFQQQYGENITYTPLLIEAVVKAIRDFPMINISVNGDTIIVKKAINIGMAVALPSGNLIVPVIHNADQYNLVGLTRKVNDLSRRARENKLTADDLANGTYTVSNIGTFGNVMGTPIIVQPQVAIMAFGAIEKKPAVIETPQGDLIGVRQKMFISHSYDHRVVDGSLGGQFVKRVSDYLEGFDPDRKIV
ncbi:dihydrolipoamide acetyltransferase family protein [Larkinella humicola]|uniref:Dihydrolipoamide acetyltransferase component of pyruvate dehydrogenase complex n=1 Tax=Larkinella humicola TaxID=2607654 RepID=A0A5N1JQQ0_9BACT|nr:dihydrolipoamide acetyltransferase family protein [Larkinella humicola]KAA9356642.1 2-oxo acid dehydrogenase subunit E2 [Larkinella humicola]